MKPHTKYLYNGKLYTAPELAKIAQVCEQQMYKRLKTMTPEAAVTYVKPPHFSTPPKLYPYHDGVLTIREFCNKTGKNYKTVAKKLCSGKSLEEIENEPKERHTNNRIPKKYYWIDSMKTVGEIAEIEKIDSSNLYRHLEKGESIEEAIQSIKRNQTAYFPYQGKMLSRPEILKLNPDVSETKLYLLLREGETYTEDDVEEILALSPKKDYYRVGNISLYQYCIEQKYNYMPIYYLIKYKKYSIEEAIDIYRKSGQGDPNIKDNTVGNILLNHFCIMEQFSAPYIYYYLQRNTSLREAIIRCCFNCMQTYKNKSVRNRLCSIYQVWETLDLSSQAILEEKYKLDNQDIAFMKECDIRIKKAFKDYDLLILAYYLDCAENDEQVKKILETKNMSEQEMLRLFQEIYSNFETLTVYTEGPIKYKWRKDETYN